MRNVYVTQFLSHIKYVVRFQKPITPIEFKIDVSLVNIFDR